jgi:hypothetical protein
MALLGLYLGCLCPGTPMLITNVVAVLLLITMVADTVVGAVWALKLVLYWLKLRESGEQKTPMNG